MFCFALVATDVSAADRVFAKRFGVNTKGDIALIGNTLMTCAAAAAGCTAGQTAANGSGTAKNNDFTPMIYVDVDLDGSTINSSSATLNLPVGSSVLFAGLYWAGNSTDVNRDKVKLQTPASAGYVDLTATTVDDASPANSYQAFIDVSSLVATGGNGVYTAANVQSTLANNQDAGWTLVVVYQNASLVSRNLTVFDGYKRVTGASQVDVLLSGFVTPSSGVVNTSIGTVAYDGDRGSTEGAAGLQFGPNAASLSPVFNTANPQTDYFNSTISVNGADVTAGRNPAYSNTLGIDIDLSRPNTPLPNGANSATVRVSSSAETIDLGVVTLATDIFVPDLKTTFVKQVTDVNGGALVPGDVLQYDVSMSNTGQDGALSVVITDVLPATTTLVPGSIQIVSGANAGAKTDAPGDDQAEYDSIARRITARVGTGANASVGGTMVPGDATVLRFQVTLNAGTAGSTVINNSAQVTSTAQTLGTVTTDTSDSNAATPGDQPTAIVVASPDLTIAKSHTGSFVRGQSGATYTLSVGNSGPAPTFGTVIVTDTLPAGLTATALSGSGWSCVLGTLTCTRSDVLAAAATYPPITLTVDVAVGTAASITNNVSVTCACEGASLTGNNAVGDVTSTFAPPTLSIAKAVVGSLTRGATGTYILTVSNAAGAGPTNGSLITVSDTLPAGLAVAATPAGSGWSCSSTPTAFTCTRSDVLAAASSYPPITVSVTVNQSAGANVSNTATVSGGGNTGSPTGNTSNAVVSSTDIAITKTVNNPAPAIGSNVTFTLTAHNAGPSDATSVVASDNLPAGLTFVSSTATQGAYNNVTGAWTIGSLATGISATLQIVATYAGPGQVTNFATVTGNEPDPNTANNTTPGVTVPSQSADLALGNTVNNAAPAVGSTVTFTLTLTNGGPANATNTAVTDQLPSGLVFVSATASQGSYNNVSGIWTAGTLNNAASATLQIVATVTGTTAMTNSAQVTASDQFDPNSAPNNNNPLENDQASVTIIPQGADLAIGKSVNNPSPSIGSNVVYTLTASNAGPTTASGVVVNDLLPGGLTFVSASASQGSYVNGTGVWTVGTLNSGATATLAITATYNGPGAVTNSATVTAATPDPNPGNNTTPGVTIPSLTADLSLAQTVNNASPNVGGNVIYTLVISNSGPDNATNVKLTDLLPPGMSFVSATPSQGTYSSATGLWTAGTINSGTSVTLQILATVTSGTPITNTAQITASDQHDPNSTPNNNNPAENDQASVTITAQSADLSLAKSVNIANPTLGQNVTFSVTVSNAGPSSALGVLVNDLLPAGLAFVSATASQGTYNNGAGVWTVGTLANSAAATLTIVATFNGPSQLTNTASASANTPDPNPVGNSASVTVPSLVADLSLTATANNLIPSIGNSITFTIAVANAGPSPGANVRAVDLLPAGLSFVSAAPSQGSYSAGSGLWLIGGINGGANATLTIVAIVTGGGAIVNTAEVTASDQFDPNSTPNNHNSAENDQSSVTLNVTGASIAGSVYIDSNANGQRNAGEAGITAVGVVLTGTDINGTAINRSTATDATGNFSFGGLAAAGPAGYTLTEQQPTGYQSGVTAAGSAGGIAEVDRVRAIALGAGVSATGYSFAELGSSLSGSVWLDVSPNRIHDAADQPLPGWIVEILDSSGATLLQSVTTGADGRYNIAGLVPGTYRLQFRDPANRIIYGVPVNGETQNPQTGSSVDTGRSSLVITLNPGENKVEQSLPVDPSGVVYNSASRQALAGAAVAFCGPAGFDPATQMVGGASYSISSNCASMTTGASGIYQFLLAATAPAGSYTLAVTPPAGFQVSVLIPAQPGTLTPPPGPGLFKVQVQADPPQPAQPTPYYQTLNLSAGSQDVIHNHIPLDSAIATQVFVAKSGSASQIEMGDSLQYRIDVRHASGPPLPAISINDSLPAGFRYIPGTARLNGARSADPQGGVGPRLSFDLGALATNQTLTLTYRVRVGVGAQQGDGINHAQAVSGAVRSNEAIYKVKVTGGVFTPEACVAGKVFVDCNGNRMQDATEIGIPGVRMYLEDGTYLISDVEGKYSFCGLTPRSHVLKLDSSTLPLGSRLSASSNRNLGDAGSLFLDLKNGELHRADFIEDSCSASVLEQVQARRSLGGSSAPTNGSGNGTAGALETPAAPTQSSEGNANTAQAEQGSASWLSQIPDAESPRVVPMQSTLVDYAANAKVARMRLEVDRKLVPADGQSAVNVTVKLFDGEGRQLRSTAYVSIEPSGGRVRLPGATTDEFGPGKADADRAVPGVQLKVEDGEGRFQLLAPNVPQDVKLRLTAGKTEVSGTVSYVPELRNMVAAGLVEGVINLNRLSADSISPARSGDGFDQEIQKFAHEFDSGKGSYAARTAFFLKGKIKGEYLLTAAYDSDKDTRSRLFRDIRPEEFYPIYGDSSVVGFDAQSSQKLYLRVDKDKSYLLFGDFATGDGFSQITGGGATATLALRNFGNYSRSLTGVRHHYETKDVVSNVFVARDSLKLVVEEFPGRGTSGPYAVSNSEAIQNSEKVEIIVRDRNQPAVILSVKPLERFVDYSFEPFSGRLLFKQPIPSVDSYLNPVSLRITYEVDQGGEKFWLGGADGDVKVNEWLQLGGSFVKDRNPLAPYQLSSAHFGVKLGDKTYLVGEVARSESTINTNTGVNTYVTPALAGQSGEVSGNAARVELRHDGDEVKARAFVARTDAEFNNPAASLNGGRGEAGARAESAITDTIKVYGEVVRSEDKIAGGKRDAAKAAVAVKLSENLQLDAGVKYAKESLASAQPGFSAPTPITAPLGSGLGDTSLSGAGGGFNNSNQSAINPVTGQPIVNTGASIATTSAPGTVNANPLDSTSLFERLSYKVSDRLSLMEEVEQDVNDSSKHRAAVGGDYLLGERSKLYARYETQTGLASMYSLTPDTRSNAFVFGVDTSYMKDGELFSEYRLHDGSSAHDAQVASGIRNYWQVTEGLRLSTGLEHLKIFTGGGQEAAAVTFGADYTGNPLWKGATKLELRRAYRNDVTPQSDTWLSTLLIARKLSTDWTFLGRNYLLYTDNTTTGDVSQDRLQLGLAYRDSATNRVNALGRYEYKVEKDDASSDPAKRRVHIVSVHSDYHPSRPWWMTGRYAAKWLSERFDGVDSSYAAQLVSGRLTYDITSKWDIGVLASLLYSPQGSSKQWAQGVEAGYQLQTNLWLSAGFNWVGFSDRDLQDSDYTNRGAFLRLRFKFDETLFQHKD